MSKYQEIKRFLIVGFSGVGVDFISYYLLLNFFEISVAKLISFILGAIVAFIFNKLWTFQKHYQTVFQMIKFSILYTITLTANVYSNEFVLHISNHLFLAFLVATGVSTVLNFLGQKFWVFK